jgi:uncharacterized protein YecE (DUF72 family)
MQKGKIHIGTSGWHYDHWVGTFYPADFKPKDFMAYFLKYFRTVELNNSFYHLPKPEVFKKWKKSVPDDFLFSVKASRYITHIKKLKDAKEGFAHFIDNAKALGKKLGPILFQLPPKWKYNEERLTDFLEALPKKKKYRYTMEFRDHTWYNESCYELLRKHNVAFCIYELQHHLSPLEATADFVYVRLHGPSIFKYAGNYSNKTLQLWADRCEEWSNQGKDVFVYFDNDQAGFAAFNGIRLMEMVGEKDVFRNAN